MRIIGSPRYARSAATNRQAGLLLFAVDDYGKTSIIPPVVWNHQQGHGGPFFHGASSIRATDTGELEILKILWNRDGPSSVRDVLEAVNQETEPPRAYTSVMSLLNVMTDKGLLRRSPHGRAFLYEPVSGREHTLRSLLGETLKRVVQRLRQLAGGPLA